MLPALQHSTVSEDEARLAVSRAEGAPYQEQLAQQLTIALKRAAIKEGLLER